MSGKRSRTANWKHDDGDMATAMAIKDALQPDQKEIIATGGEYYTPSEMGIGIDNDQLGRRINKNKDIKKNK